MAFINKAEVKKLALSLSQSSRAGKFTRVGKSFLDRVEAATRNRVAAEVAAHPSVGRTLQ